LSSLQLAPVAQTVAPLYPVPPHWPYKVWVAPGADDVMLDDTVMDELDETDETDEEEEE